MKPKHWLLAVALAGSSNLAMADPTSADHGIYKEAETTTWKLPDETSTAFKQPLLTSHYAIKNGWLSDAVRELGQQAGYNKVLWTPDPEGRLDFRIHGDFSLRAVTAMEALSNLVAPYPIRLCFYMMDSVVQAIPQTHSCLKNKS